MTKVRSLPAVPQNVEPQLRRFLETIKESVEVRLGYRGDRLDRSITFRDLLGNDTEWLVSALNNIDDDKIPDTILPGPNPWDDETTPDRPTGLIVVSLPSFNMLRWNRTEQLHVSGTEIYRLDVDNWEAALAQGPVATADGVAFSDPVSPGEGTDWYYWVRFITYTAGPSLPNKLEGTRADGQRLTDEQIENLDILKLVREEGKTYAETLIGDNEILDNMVSLISAEKIYAGELTVAQAIIGDAHIERAMVKDVFADRLWVDEGTIAEAIIEDADITNAMIGNRIESTQFSATSGWRLSKDGLIEATAIVIRDNLGEVILNSSGTAWNKVIGTFRPEDGATRNGIDQIISDPNFDRVHSTGWGTHWSLYGNTAGQASTAYDALEDTFYAHIITSGTTGLTNYPFIQAEDELRPREGDRYRVVMRARRSIDPIWIDVRIRMSTTDGNFLPSESSFAHFYNFETNETGDDLMAGTPADTWMTVEGTLTITATGSRLGRVQVGLANSPDPNVVQYLDVASLQVQKLPRIDYTLDLGENKPPSDADSTAEFFGVEPLNRLPGKFCTVGHPIPVGKTGVIPSGSTTGSHNINTKSAFFNYAAAGHIHQLPAVNDYSYYGEGALKLDSNGTNSRLQLYDEDSRWEMKVQDTQYLIVAFAACGVGPGGFQSQTASLFLEVSIVGGIQTISPSEMMVWDGNNWIVDNGTPGFRTESGGWGLYFCKFDVGQIFLRGSAHLTFVNYTNNSQIYLDGIQIFKGLRESAQPPENFYFPAGSGGPIINSENSGTYIKKAAIVNAHIATAAVDHLTIAGRSVTWAVGSSWGGYFTPYNTYVFGSPVWGNTAYLAVSLSVTNKDPNNEQAVFIGATGTTTQLNNNNVTNCAFRLFKNHVYTAPLFAFFSGHNIGTYGQQQRVSDIYVGSLAAGETATFQLVLTGTPNQGRFDDASMYIHCAYR